MVPTANGLGETAVIVGPLLSMYAYAIPYVLPEAIAVICTGFCAGSLTGAV